MSSNSTMVRTRDVAVHVRLDGPDDAPAVLLLHGFAGSAHWFDDVTAELSEELRVIRVDLRGHGRTGGHSGLDAPEQADTIAQVLDALHVERVAAAVGHSFGSDIALELAERGHADRVVTIGQAPDYRCASKTLRLLVSGPPVVASALHKRVLSIPALARHQRLAFAPRFRPSKAQLDRTGVDYAAMVPEMYRTIGKARTARFTQRPLDQHIRELGLPALSIHGSRDLMYDSVASAERYRAAGAETAIVDGTGHSPNVEAPTRVAELIRAFVTR